MSAHSVTTLTGAQVRPQLVRGRGCKGTGGGLHQAARRPGRSSGEGIACEACSYSGLTPLGVFIHVHARVYYGRPVPLCDFVVSDGQARLCREMLPESPGIAQDEILAEVVGFLEACQERLVDLIEGGAQGLLPENVFELCLRVNDAVLKTLEAEKVCTQCDVNVCVHYIGTVRHFHCLPPSLTLVCGVEWNPHPCR